MLRYETTPGVFRPINHPLANKRIRCPKCRASRFLISLPGYPGDWYDCESCEHSWKPTAKDTAKMLRKPTS